jgi:RNA polymerase sigma-70 factor (ECF subfamily)
MTVGARALRSQARGAKGRHAPMRVVSNDNEDARAARFRAMALPYVDDVYSLARYLLGNTADAEDAAQEAFLRAFRHFDTFRGVAIKSWLFAILRNVCWTIRKSSAQFAATLDDDDDRAAPLWSAEGETPETEVLRKRDSTEVRRLLYELPVAFREVLVLREIDDLSYREIAEIVGVPVGTIMSRLARGRAMLRAAWLASESGEKAP